MARMYGRSLKHRAKEYKPLNGYSQEELTFRDCIIIIINIRKLGLIGLLKIKGIG